MGRKKVLIADDDANIIYAFKSFFKKEGFQSIEAKDGEEALEKIKVNSPDLSFLDISMPKLNGMEVLQELKKMNYSLPVIIITGNGTMDTAINAIKKGAFDYLIKPLDLETLRKVIYRVFYSTSGEIFEESKINYNFKENPFNDYIILGKSRQMQKVFKLIGAISVTPNYANVLITGESGTGKELVARNIHRHSSNSSKPFVAINCASLPENLLESELFGYEKGAFTGAFQRKFGKFEIAGSGTIFLDEIGNLTFNLQQKLLRVLQSRQFERVGGNETLNVNARFIAAANVDLEKEVNDGNFRKDLFYRLNVASIYLPSLSEKREDIPLLVEFFLAKSNYFLKKKVKGLSKEAIEFLKNYDYPGNIRELENIIERGVMLTKGDLILPNALPVMKKKVEKSNELIKTNNNFKQARNSILSDFEKEFLIKNLVKFKGNISLAAITTGMTRQNFQRLLRKYNITADKFRKRDF